LLKKSTRSKNNSEEPVREDVKTLKKNPSYASNQIPYDCLIRFENPNPYICSTLAISFAQVFENNVLSLYFS